MAKDKRQKTIDNGQKTIDNSQKTKGIRHRLLIKDIVHRPKEKMSKILADNGYSKSIQSNPKSVLKTKSFQTELARYFKDEKLIKSIDEGLKADKPIVIDKMINDYPDYDNRFKYLQLLLRLKNYLNDNQNQVNIQANDYKLVITKDSRAIDNKTDDIQQAREAEATE